MTGFLPRTAGGLQSNLLCLWKPLKSVAIFVELVFLAITISCYALAIPRLMLMSNRDWYSHRSVSTKWETAKSNAHLHSRWICLWQTENVNEWQMKFIQHWRKRVEKIAPPHIAALELIWNWIMIFCESDGFKSCCTIFVTLRIPLLAKQSYTTAIQNN